MTEGARVVDSAIMETLPLPVWTARPDGSLTYANPAWLAYTGVSKPSSLGGAWTCIVHPEDVPVIEDRFQTASAAGEPCEVEIRFRRADGVYRWHLAHVAPLRDPEGGLVGWVGTATDIDERKRAEADRAWLSAIAGGTQDAIVGGTLDGAIVGWNPGAEQLYGYTAEEVLGQNVALLVPPDRVPELGWVRQQLERGDAVPPFETERLRKDGTRVTVMMAVSPIRDRDGRLVGISAIYRDRSGETAARVERRERERQAELVAAVGTAMTARLPLADQLQRCAEAIVTHLEAAFTRVWTLDDEDDGTLVLRASAGLYTHLDGHHGRIPVGRWKIGRIAAERRPHLTNAVVGDPEVSDQGWAEREGMVAFAGYPLLVGERLLGVLGLFAQHPLDESALVALSSVADTLAVGIDRARAEAAREALLVREQAAREHAEAVAATLGTLNRVGRLLTAELDLDRLVQAVTDAATELTKARFGAFFYNVVDDRGQSYTLYALSGAPREAFERYPMPRATAVFGPTFRGEGVLRLADVRRDLRYGQNAPYAGLPTGHLPVVSYLAVPVVSRSGEVLGGLFFGHPEPGVFDEQAEELAIGLAAHAAVAIDNARLFQDAQVAERRYRTLFEGVADAILVADAERRYRDANTAATDLLGYTREELLRLRVEDVVAREASWTEAEYARFRTEGRWQGELELQRKDGVTVPVEAVASVVELRTGQMYLSAVRDVSERKQAERLKQEFLEAVSHDLKNPLTSVRAQAQLLARRAGKGTLNPDTLGRSLAGIEAAAQRMETQLSELQDAARLRAGPPLELQVASVDLAAMAEEAVTEIRGATSRHDVRLDVPYQALVGQWDGLRLRRVLDNLLSNAVKYSEGGEIVVTVREDQREDGHWVVLAVRDEGVGIPAVDLPHVFERYRRGSNVGKHAPGTGIGLSGACKIVHQHGGTISVESEEGRGSTFTVALPILPMAPPISPGGEGC